MKTRYALPVLAIVGLLTVPAATREAAAAELVRATAEAIEPIRAPFAMPQLEGPSFPDRTFDITKYGAISGGTQKNTEAFARAIKACHDAGGGTVLVPKGVWLTGPIRLKSNVRIHLEKDAEIRFSTDFDDYRPLVFTRWNGMECYTFSSLIYARACENIAITGEGTLNGQGKAWFAWEPTEVEAKKKLYRMVCDNVPVAQRQFGEVGTLRPSFVHLVSCKNVLLEGLTVGQGPQWTIHPAYCENVICRRLKVLTYEGPNLDGLNPDSCRNVLIEHCEFDTGDDCIALKSGVNEDGWRVGRPCENVIIRHCKVRRGHGGVVIGSEMSGGVRNVYVRDCQFDQTNIAIRMKSLRGRGGTIENIWVEDCAADNMRFSAIGINMFYEAYIAPPKTQTPPTLRNVHFKNIRGQGSQAAVTIRGLPERRAQDITVEDVVLAGKKGFECVDAEGIVLKHVSIRPDEGPAFSFSDSTGITLNACTAEPPKKHAESK